MSRKARKVRRRSGLTKEERKERYEKRLEREGQNAAAESPHHKHAGDLASGTTSVLANAELDKDPKESPKRKWYVLDTNLLLSCPEIICDPRDKSWRPPLKFEPNLDDAHLIIPETVIKELGHMKGNKNAESAIRAAAGKVLDRLLVIFENSGITIRELMNLGHQLPTGWKTQTISKLKLYDGFEELLPSKPKENDNDAWIAVTALAATMIRDGLPVNGKSVTKETILDRSNRRSNVILLTCDKYLRLRGGDFAVRTMPYSFAKVQLNAYYRNLIVPDEMYSMFCVERSLSGQEFERFMPNEPPLEINEYIIMRPDKDTNLDDSRAVAARYYVSKNMLVPMRYERERNRKPADIEAEICYDALNDERISTVVVNSGAEANKALIMLDYGAKAVCSKKYKRLILVAPKVASDAPGGFYDYEKQMQFLVSACESAIRTYLASTHEFTKLREELKQSDKYKREEYDLGLDYKTLSCMRERVRYCQFDQIAGQDLENAFIFVDGTQHIRIEGNKSNMNRIDAICRINSSKLIWCGGVWQTRSKSVLKTAQNGFEYMLAKCHDSASCVNVFVDSIVKTKSVKN